MGSKVDLAAQNVRVRLPEPPHFDAKQMFVQSRRGQTSRGVDAQLDAVAKYNAQAGLDIN